MTSIALRDTGGRLRRRPAISADARRLFLEALEAGWSVAHAARRAGVHRRRFYDRRETDDKFAAAWNEAIQVGTQALEDEARRRAMDGWDEPVFQRGELVGQVRKYDSSLLMFLLKKRDPSYRDNARLEVTGAGGGPVEVAAGYQPPTLEDMVRLAGELGVLDQLGYSRPDVVDGEAVEVAGELEGGDPS